MSNRSYSFIFSIFLLPLISVSALAECIPKDEACAPKKKIGEWDNSLAFGYNMTSGNSDTQLVTILGKSYYEKDKNIVDSTFMYNFGSDSNAKDETGDDTTRNDFRLLSAYNRLLDDRMYLGMGGKFFYDEIAQIDYRVFIDPSMGYYLLKDNTFKFRVEAGPSYIFEEVDSVKDDYLAPRLGDKFEYYLSCTSKLYQSAEILFDVNNSENYLVNAEVGIEAALSTELSLVFLVRETFDNEPAEGREKDDLAMISALKVSI